MRRGQQPQHETFNPHDVVVYDIETVVAERDTPADGSFPPWPRHRPVSAAFLRARWTTAGYEFTLKTAMCAAGEEAAFYEEVERQLPANVTAVTFNGRGFDNRVLAIQAMKHAPGFGLSIGVQKGPPIGVQKGPPSSSSVTGMTGALFALVAA
jgi:hypothetical protein